MLTTLIVFGAKYLIALPALALIVYGFLLPRRRWLLFGTVALGSAALGYAFARLAGLLYGHAQPFALEGFTPLVPHAVDNAFPSDHTTIAAALATAALLYNRPLGIVLWVCAFLIGLSRMAAGLHWGVDVAVGAALGALAAVLAKVLLEKFSSREVA